MFFLLLGFLSSFLWNIEINGLEQTSNEEVLDYLDENGIAIGKFKRMMPKEQIKRLLLEEYDYFSFIEAQYRGIKLTIDISLDIIKIINYEYREVEVEEVRQDIDSLKKSNELLAIEELNELKIRRQCIAGDKRRENSTD